jgi:soluble lytic murein transglycosylase-like protein
LSKIQKKKIGSKLYYWMSVWTTQAFERSKYIKAIKTHHPMSFYLWSPLALGQGLELETSDLNKFKKGLKREEEKNLIKIMKTSELSLAQSFIRYTEKNFKSKKTLNWKKLKALNGLYADLLLDLNAGLISPNKNMQFFFSRGFSTSVSKSSERFMIPKELIWSITRQESNFNTYARSWADAFGLMQILPKRAVSFLNDTKDKKAQAVTAINPFKLFEPDFNISVGAWLLRENLNSFDDKLPLAIASYNASIGKVEEWEQRFFKGNWIEFIEEVTYRETRKYIKLVSRNLEIYKALENAKPKEKK